MTREKFHAYSAAGRTSYRPLLRMDGGVTRNTYARQDAITYFLFLDKHYHLRSIQPNLMRIHNLNTMIAIALLFLSYVTTPSFGSTITTTKMEDVRFRTIGQVPEGPCPVKLVSADTEYSAEYDRIFCGENVVFFHHF